MHFEYTRRNNLFTRKRRIFFLKMGFFYLGCFLGWGWDGMGWDGIGIWDLGGVEGRV